MKKYNSCGKTGFYTQNTISINNNNSTDKLKK